MDVNPTRTLASPSTPTCRRSATHHPIRLRRSQPLPLPAAVGTEILCEDGAVWITQDHDIRDIVLKRGERFRLDVDAPAMVQAFDTATISLHGPATCRSR